MQVSSKMSRKAALIVAAALAMVSVSSTAKAVNYGDQVNLSGATLFADYFTYASSTRDYIDIDHDGNTTEQLATTPTINSSTVGDVSYNVPTTWEVNQRGVGSGNGLAEFVSYQLSRIHGAAAILPTSAPSEQTTLNRVIYSDKNGAATSNASSATNRSPIAFNSIDIAVMDVPTTWFIKGSTGTSTWNKSPNAAGYGANTLKDATGAQSNSVKSLSATINGTSQSLNVNTSSANASTIYDTQVAWVPVAVIANAGTGIDSGNIKMSDLQFLNVTGRMASGENLVAVTRDSGSGTRNAMVNSIGVDPTYGMGDNYGGKNNATANNVLGSTFIASNKGGSGHMEDTVMNSRLAIGYTGLDGGSRAEGDARAGQYEILNIGKDISSSWDGVSYVRASKTSVIQNSNVNTGYQIGGAETFATVGDPLAAYDFNNDGDTLDAGEAAFDGHAGAQAMDNKNAALYIRNIIASINGYVDQTVGSGTPSADGTPAQGLVSTYTLMAAISAMPSSSNPTAFVQDVSLFKQAVQDASLSTYALNVPGFGSVNSGNGKVSTRTAGVNYTDGNGTGNSYYVNLDGTTLAYGSNNNSRNKIAGDFDGNGARNTADVANMMATVKYRLTNDAGDKALIANQAGYSPELVGDFNSDGNFDAKDVRYWADGLHMVNGKLDRKAGFTAVDNAWTATVGARVAGNFFATTLATGKTYAAGDSRGDVAGATTLGAGSIYSGANGTIDATDIDYVMSMRNVGSWASLLTNAATDASKLIVTLTDGTKARADLSADINGDLVLSQADVDELVTGVLGTHYGDINLDGNVNQTDLNTMVNNWGTAANAGWAKGDLNGDGSVNQLDLNIMVNNWALGLTSNEVIAAYGLSIPEPTSMALLAIGGMMLMARRRQA